MRIEFMHFCATNVRVCKVPTRSLSAWPLDMILQGPAGNALAERSCASWADQRAAITRSRYVAQPISEELIGI